MHNNPPMLTKAGKVKIKVINMILIDLASLISLKTLIILNVRKTLVDVPTELRKPKFSKRAVTEDKTTKRKSN